MRMKMMMAVTVLWVVLLPYGVSGGNKKPHPLDMVPNSVDDMYEGCVADMEKKAEEFLKEERKDSKVFNQIWEKMKANQSTNVLTKEEITALSVYTSDAIYSDFNKATREQGLKYKTAFKYHALHFYLTRAVQKLKPKEECYNVYRRTPSTFSDSDVLEKEVRLGSFSSTSRRDNLTKYGNNSCFEIYTCMGADVSHFSEYDEAEVLIPPYEVFKVTKITKRSEQPSGDLWCDVVYKLNNTGYQSNRNCEISPKKGQ